MAKNKYDFISELIENKKIPSSQRERITQLALKEMHSDGNLTERVKKIEALVLNNASVEEDDTDLITWRNSPNLPDYLRPINQYKYLIAFNQNPILKYTCHNIDIEALKEIITLTGKTQYEFEEHLKIIIQNFNAHDQKYSAQYSLKALFRAYLTGKNYNKENTDGWGSENLIFNWSHKKILEWAAENPNTPPNLSPGAEEISDKMGFEFIPEPLKAGNKSLFNMNQLVLFFKHKFHIRLDNSFFDIISMENTKKGWGNYVTFSGLDSSFPKNVVLFTNVDKVREAYNKIISMCIAAHQGEDKPEISITLEQKDASISLAINHLNSTYKSLIDLLERPGDTISKLIKNQINGLCEFYLKADFGQGVYTEVNLWNGKPILSKPIDKFRGVTHILKFIIK